MPHIRSLGSSESPRVRPISYPGAVVALSSLVTSRWFYPLQPRPGTPVAEWGIDADGGPLPPSARSLAAALEAVDAAPMSQRHPVLAVGSNAAPSQLRAKFAASAVCDVVPITRVKVRGLMVGHSAHISAAGYIPYAPLAGSARSPQHLSITWLDPEQLELINATEPNYCPTTVTAYPAALETGDPVSDYVLYRTRWGVLRAQPGGSAVAATSQAEVFRFLMQHLGFRSILPELTESMDAAMRALATDPARRDAVREWLAADGLVAPDGLA